MLVSECCDAPSFGESDLCGKCKEHTEFHCDEACVGEYQPEEKENNVPESYTCIDCGAQLEIPSHEPDWDGIAKETV